jgi:chaperonin GroEL
MTNRTVFGAEMRKGLMEGINRAANSVAPTLGAGGLPMLHYMEGQDQKGNYADVLNLTKDGVTVLKAIQSLQPLVRSGEKMVREASEGVVKAAGDGTTATAILVQAICQYGMEALDEGYNPVKLKREIEAAVKDVVIELKKLSKPVEGIADLIKIATISANNDPIMGKMVAEAFEKVGVHGIITADISTNISDSIEVADGMIIEKGYTDPNFMNNPAKGVIELNDCYILMLSEKVEDRKEYVRVILDRFFLETQAIVPVLIVAEEFGVMYTSFFLSNNNGRNGYQFACINTPAGGAQRDEIMEDLAKVTNGIYISGKQLDRIEGIAAKCPKYKPDPNNPVRQFDGKYIVTPYFGKAKKVIISLTSTTIIGGKGKEVAEKNVQAQRGAILQEKATKLTNHEKQSDKWEGKPQVAEGIVIDYDQKLAEVRNEFDVYVDNIRERITNEKNPQLIEFLKKRLANITGSVAVINVGGLNEQSIKERKDRYDDAICAVKAASEEGYLAGGGTALMLLSTSYTESKGSEIVLKAMQKPFEQILVNAGIWEMDIYEEYTNAANPSEKKPTLLKKADRTIPFEEYGQGYNALTGEIVNMFDEGIIDSTKVVRCEIEYAANAAITFLTAGGAIC